MGKNPKNYQNWLTFVITFPTWEGQWGHRASNGGSTPTGATTDRNVSKSFFFYFFIKASVYGHWKCVTVVTCIKVPTSYLVCEHNGGSLSPKSPKPPHCNFKMVEHEYSLFITCLILQLQ